MSQDLSSIAATISISCLSGAIDPNLLNPMNHPPKPADHDSGSFLASY